MPPHVSHTDVGGLGIGAPVGASEGVLDATADGVLDSTAEGVLDPVAPVGASEGVGLQPDRLTMA